MKELQAITERVARHQRDHPVGPKTDTELLMAYIVTLHSRIEDLERRVTNPHSAPSVDQQWWTAYALGRPTVIGKDVGLDELRAQWTNENSIVGDEQ